MSSGSYLSSSGPPAVNGGRVEGRSGADLQVHVVEDHHEVLPHIYRAIASKKLPYKGNILLHFDAHPDLLSPDIHADKVKEKEVLFSKTDIADWILPAIYMGHFSRVVWVKPPWAWQIREGRHQLCVGKDRASGHLRVSNPLPYFIGELLCVEKKELENPVTIPLDVVTLYPFPSFSSLDKTPPTSPSHTPLPPGEKSGVKRSLVDDSNGTNSGTGMSQIFTPSPKRLKLDSSISETGSDQGGSIVVCTPPEKGVTLGRCDSLCAGFDNVELAGTETGDDSQRHVVCLPAPKRMGMSCGGLTCSSEEHLDADIVNTLANASAWVLDVDLDFFSTGNPYRSIYSEEQYKLLTRLYKFQDPSNDSPEALRECIKTRKKQLSDLEQLWKETQVSTEARRDFQLTTEDESLIEGMKSLEYNDSLVDSEYLHLSGMLTDQPVHTSSEGEVRGLMEAVCSSLKAISKKPSIITIARSTEDEYTPSDQVAIIQEQVLATLQCLYGNNSQPASQQLWIQCHYSTSIANQQNKPSNEI